jgi:MATE family multidrug resistance protein
MAAFMVPFSLLTVFKASFEAVGRPGSGPALAFVGVLVNVPLNGRRFTARAPRRRWASPAGVASVAAESLALA